MGSPAAATENPFAGCPACGAEHHPQARFCWLCGAPQAALAESPVVAQIVADKRPAWLANQNPWVVQASIWAGIVLAILVGYGVLQIKEPLLAGAYLIVIVPALLFTIAGSALGRAAGRPWDPGKKVFAFMGVFGVTLAVGTIVVVLIVVSAIIAFFQMCFGGGR
jgi:hypothetical protein